MIESQIPDLALRSRGKVRDIYEEGDYLLLVATDRISAFDCVMPVGIPHKGAVLTQLSLFWFDFFKSSVKNHLAPMQTSIQEMAHRSMLVKKAKMLPVECVARGYLAGSGWKEYRELGSICGIRLPSGLQESSKLPEPIFTPASKAESGHDENISFDRVVTLVGRKTAENIRDLTLRIYREASLYAQQRGIIIADTKFEFGFVKDELTLADEVLTPDSSRFWPVKGYEPGRAQPSFDKQFVRDYLETLDWNKQPPAPPLPKRVIEQTSSNYLRIFEILTDSPSHLL